MAVKIGSNDLKLAYVGSAAVKQIWVGGTMVWSAAPDINFYADPGWNSSAAAGVWTFQDDVSADALRYANYVRLEGGVFATYPAWTYRSARMEAEVGGLDPDGLYRLTVVCDAISSPYVKGGCTVFYADNTVQIGNFYGPGTYTAQFSPDGSGSFVPSDSVLIRINASHTGSEPQSGYVQISQVYIERIS